MCGVSITLLSSGWDVGQDEEPEPPAAHLCIHSQQLEEAFPLFTATSQDPGSELKVVSF